MLARAGIKFEIKDKTIVGHREVKIIITYYYKMVAVLFD